MPGHASGAGPLPPVDWPQLAQTAHDCKLTLVIYMGVQSAAKLQQGLLQGLPPDTPVAVVETIAAAEEDNIKTLRLCYSPKGPNIESNRKAKSKELPIEDRNWLSVASLSKPWTKDSSHHVNLKQRV